MPQGDMRVDKFAFPLALLELNLRIITRANLRSRARWPASFSCQRAMFRIASELSAPGGASQKIGTENKKPGVKRRASPSTVSWEGFARSSTVVYPVFVSNLTSLLRERLPARRDLRASPVFRHPRSIRVSARSSSGMPIIFCGFPVNFTAHVENDRPIGLPPCLGAHVRARQFAPETEEESSEVLAYQQRHGFSCFLARPVEFLIESRCA
jgi:hypothetical protein